MPNPASPSDRSFRLAAHSRARRRLILRQKTPQAPQEAELPVEEGVVPIDSIAPPPAIEPVEVAAAADTAAELETTAFEIVSAVGGPPESEAAITALRAVDFGAFHELLLGQKPVTWVFAGDSITQGACYTDGRRSYPEHFAERVRWEIGRYHDAVINTAAPKETSQTLLADFEWRSLRFRPDVVSVMIGVHDCAGHRTRRSEFQENVRHVIECIRADGALPLLHTPPRITFGDPLAHADLRSRVKILRDLARELDVPCVDHWAFWKRAATNGEDTSVWLTPDRLHPTAEGHRIMASLLFHRFGIFDERSATCAACAW